MRVFVLFLPMVFFLVIGKAQSLTVKHEVFFSNNSHTLENSQQQKLDKFVKENLKNKKLEISEVHIHGHCDRKGSHQLNDTLSLKRSQEVASFLQASGIDMTIVQKKGFGKRQASYPLSNDTLNRRVELIVVYDSVALKKQATSSISTAQVGENITFQHIQFYPGTANPLPQVHKTIDSLALQLLAHPTIEIEIQGHICCDTNDVEDLSTRRAFYVYEFLVNNGVDKGRLTYKGYGRSRPLTNESTPELQQENRRVEIKILNR
jgi:outer membrane protein OmpA-like peptidoglycan-associated protein